MMDRTLLVLGAGGHGKSVAEAALLSGEWQDILFLDDAWPSVSVALDCPVVGKTESVGEWASKCQGAIAAVGNNSVRQSWIELIEHAGIELVSIIHPRAWVSPSATVGAGTAVMAGAVLGTVSSVGKGAIINCNATVDHDVVMDDFSHLGVGVQLAGGVKVGAAAWLQAGSSCGYNVVVEAGVVHGAGTVLR
ncbi:acetyltransferase [Halopseudomonas sp. SMJS2]|uniref:acetyltransferase n=1 Tax=Halopseudomonas sp. SMJS2 TaxID=3041098 RepID=UPI0024535E79|nr:acetyltransferase [Halopseudomonas sp. SMJS2]WGK60357.1 acetyltransferase [Halopseudomonas sp. SMJS2]